MKKKNTFYILLSMLFLSFASQAQSTEITSHVNGSQLDSTTVTLEWQGDWDAEEYYFGIGQREGANDICFTYRLPLEEPYQLVSELPANGMDIYVTVATRVGEKWRYDYFNYKTPEDPDLPAGADMILPVNGSTLTSTSATFEWQDIGAFQYWLDIGDIRGGKGYYSASLGYSAEPFFNTSVTVDGLPISGIPLYVRLWTQLEQGSEWVYTDWTYTAYRSPSYWDPATMISPVPKSHFDSTTVTFEWEDIGADSYSLAVGAWPGNSTYGGSSYIYTTSYTIENLPDTGEKIYVRLRSRMPDGSRYIDYYYSAHSPPAP